MEQAFDFIRVPRPDMAAILITLGILVGLFFLAIILEISRRAKDRVARIEAEWLSVKDIVRDKDLSKGEWNTLDAMIKEYAPTRPLDAITTRKRFNECVSSYMDAVFETGNMQQYEQVGLLLRDLRIRLALDYAPYGQRLETTREFSEPLSFLAARMGDARPHWCRLHIMHLDEAYLCVSVERLKTDDHMPAWAKGDTLQCRMWREDDARYTFEIHVAKVDLEEGQAWLYHTEELTRVQSRAYYRVGHNQPVSIAMVSYPANGDFDDIESRPAGAHVRGRITSISAGGLAIETLQSIPSHVLMRLTLDLPGAEPITVHVAIVGEFPLSMFSVHITAVPRILPVASCVHSTAYLVLHSLRKIEGRARRT